MKLKDYDPKKSIPCYIQFQGCEPEECDRQEQRDAICAAVVTLEPCKAWEIDGLGLGKKNYSPGSDLSKNIASHISKNGMSDRARRLAEEMECCHLDALMDDLPMEFPINRETCDEEDPYVEVDGFVQIYPTFTGVAFGRCGRFGYDLICSYTGQAIDHKTDRRQAIVAAATLAFEYSAKCKLNLMSNYSDVPESRGF